jgi:hypothetical protein
MPGFNRKGPQGQGPLTGRGMGKCNPGNRDANDAIGLKEDSFFGGNRNRYRMRYGGAKGRGRGRGFCGGNS